MKAAIPYIIIAILAAAICVLLQRGCGTSIATAQDNASVDSAARAYADKTKADSALILRLEADSATKQDSIDNLSRQVAWYEVELVNTGKDIGATIKNMDCVRIIHDTPALVISCDTLEQQVKAARVEIHGFRLASDSLVLALADQGRIKDSISQAWRSAFLHADTAETFLQTKYNSLYSDYSKQQKKNSITTKVLGGAVLVLIGGLLLKK